MDPLTVWLVREAGECGRLGPEFDIGGSGISVGAARGAIDTSAALVRALCNGAVGVVGDSVANSGDETSLGGSLLIVDRLVAGAVGVGDLSARDDGFLLTLRRDNASTGEGRLWMTLRRSLFVRMAADCIIGT
jgi:hypothetical protein